MLQTFHAKDMKEALSAMRAALGDDAVIVSSETGGDGRIMLCAATGMPDAEPQPKAASIASFETRYRERLLGKLRSKSDAPTFRAAEFVRTDLLQRLKEHRTPESLAHALAEAAEASGFIDPSLALASALDKRMRLAPIDAVTANAVLLIGPNGAGKTAVAAKLAAEAVLVPRAAVLAATDLKSAGARERLETFAVHLGIPIADASSPDLLSDAIAAARENGAMLIADTAGCDLRNPPESLVQAAQAEGIECIGVVSATMDAEEAADTAAALAELRVQRLIVTGFDLARRKGAACALASSGLALAHATASPYLVEGLDSLTPTALARALLSALDGPDAKGMTS